MSRNLMLFPGYLQKFVMNWTEDSHTPGHSRSGKPFKNSNITERTENMVPIYAHMIKWVINSFNQPLQRLDDIIHAVRHTHASYLNIESAFNNVNPSFIIQIRIGARLFNHKISSYWVKGRLNLRLTLQSTKVSYWIRSHLGNLILMPAQLHCISTERLQKEHGC